MKNRIVHVARDGKVIGQYPPERLPTLLEEGTLFSGDYCYTEMFPTWIPLHEFLEKTQPTRLSSDSVATAEPQEKLPPRRNLPARRSPRRKEIEALLFAWVSFLLVLSALVGAGFWIYSLNNQLIEQTNQIAFLKDQLVVKDKENQRLLFAGREVAESGVVRGAMILRNEAGKRLAMPGMRIALYRRADIEKHLDERFEAAKNIPAGTSMDGVRFMLENLPVPLLTTSTDASGRFDFKLPAAGEYALVTSISSGDSKNQRIWFISFDSNDPVNSLIEINESNSVQQFNRNLILVQGR